MTREEAVSLLRRYRKEIYRMPKGSFISLKRSVLFRTSVYGSFLVEEMIRRIRESDSPPIAVVRKFYAALDDILCESDDDHFETHRFASQMEFEAGNLLQYLQAQERRRGK